MSLQKGSSKSPQIAIIGAGPCGLVAAKTLKECGISVVCFEMGDRVGGLWSINNKNGRSGAYHSLHINTSTTMTQFSDFALTTDAGDFPSHAVMGRYFSDYADHFELHEVLKFGIEVGQCMPMTDGYRLSLFDRTTKAHSEEHFDGLIVANGHHWDPSYPHPLPTCGFKGATLHSASYMSPQDPMDVVGMRVLVVGIGNSAVDIACEICEAGARSVSLSSRRGAWVLPKYFRKKPIDQGGGVPHFLPAKFRRALVTRLFRAFFGSMSQFGLPEPDHLIGEAHPTISTKFPLLVQAQKISVVPEILRAMDRTVEFADGQQKDFDLVVYCTGYKISFPFFDPAHICALNNELSLYHRIFHPLHRRVFFVGLAQPFGAIMPVAEQQAKMIAAHLQGRYNLPEPHKMQEVIAATEQEMKERFVASARHTMQLDPRRFAIEIKKDLLHGKKRAERSQGVSFPFS